MALDALHSGPAPAASTGLPLTRPIELTCFALCVANAVYLAASLAQGGWLLGTDGRPIATDFVNFWAAGRQVLDGHPDAAYVSSIHKAMEAAAVGHSFEGDYPLIYPPTFLFLATLLACMPYVQAFVVWILLTFSTYLVALRRIIGQPVGILFACAYPAIVSNLVVGQNGFVTAALLAGTFTFMERRPLLAGGFLGLLSFKPHLGILFPIVLIIDRRWRVIASAGAVVILLAGASVLTFGAETWEAFLRSLSLVSHAALADGVADLAKLQSLFGIIRVLGGGETLAWTLQGMLAGTTAIVLCVIWRSRIPFDLKAAALATGALLATPYLFIYDLAALALPMAYILRAATQTGAWPGEMLGLGGACLLVLIFPFVKAPVGLAALLIVAVLVMRRVLDHRHEIASGLRLRAA